MKVTKIKKMISVFLAFTFIVMCSPMASAEMFATESGYETITFDVSEMEIVSIDPSLLLRSPRSTSLPYDSSIIFGRNSTVAASPIFDVSFSSNTDGIFFTPTNFTGTKKIKISLYVHLSGESSTKWRCTSTDDYTFNGITGQKFQFGTSTTTIDRFYIEFGGGTSGYATEFDYNVRIA